MNGALVSKYLCAAAFAGFMVIRVEAEVAIGSSLSGYQNSSLFGAFSQDELDKLVAPVALYPDPLLAIMLPASTQPNQISQAANAVAASEPRASVDSQAWDASVKGLLHYPEVLQWMSQNIEWTTSLGAAFATQQQDVLSAIQRDRSKAKSVGNLSSTPQQTVTSGPDDISIQPTQPNWIYVPQYDWTTIYYNPSPTVVIIYSQPLPAGVWLLYDLNWMGRELWVYAPGVARTASTGYKWQAPAAVRANAAYALKSDTLRSVRTGGNVPLPASKLGEPRASVLSATAASPRSGGLLAVSRICFFIRLRLRSDKSLRRQELRQGCSDQRVQRR